MPYINNKKQEELLELQQLYNARIKIAKHQGVTLGLGIAAVILWIILIIGCLIKGFFSLALMILGGLVILIAFLIPCCKDFAEN